MGLWSCLECATDAFASIPKGHMNVGHMCPSACACAGLQGTLRLCFEMCVGKCFWRQVICCIMQHVTTHTFVCAVQNRYALLIVTVHLHLLLACVGEEMGAEHTCCVHIDCDCGLLCSFGIDCCAQLWDTHVLFEWH